VSKPHSEPNEPLIPAGDPIPVPLQGDFAGVSVQFDLEAVLELDFVSESLDRPTADLPPTDDPIEQRRRTKAWYARRAAYLVWRVNGLRDAPERGNWEAWVHMPLVFLRWVNSFAYQEAGRQALSLFRSAADVAAVLASAPTASDADPAAADAPASLGVGPGAD
jgi:hypothetical protein